MKNITLTKLFAFILFLISLSLGGCYQRSRHDVSVKGDSIKFQYAQQITAVKYPKYTVVNLKDPWNEGKILHTYILVARKDSESVNHLPQGTIVYTPIKRGVVFATALCKLTEELGALDQVAGVADLRFMLIPAVHQRVAEKKIVDCGDAMSPMVEKIIDLSPDAIFLSPFSNSGGYGQLGGLEVPMIEMADYMETSALGRAEWMKFYGMLFGREKSADSLFHVVDSTYNGLKAEVAKLPLGRSILTERKTGSVWYCPGGQSTIGQLIADAGGRYAFANDKHSGSLALSFEKVLEKAGNSTVWAFKFNGDRLLSRKDLLAEYHGYDGLQAFKNGDIFECNGSVKPLFEETPFRPDYLLNDLIIMLHPGNPQFGSLKYYEKIKE